ncbi:TetR/AcrR family transcriptional regulator [Frigoribacterium sp. R86507]|uniref:TetR/AcrR family transcriptional regulator n=1 Tax=Frigoribacterium sp. R86507 TaxID=3093850 RepID=UPI0037CAC6C7
MKPDDEEARVDASRTSRRTRETRRKLVEAGVALLRRADYAAVPVAEITQLADVGLGTFYNHFAGKDELFDEAVQSVLNAQTERMAALGHTADSPVTTAAIAMHVVLGLAQSDPAVAVVVARNGLRLLDAEAALVPQARALVEAGQAAGSFAELDVDLALSLVGGSLLGGLHTWWSSPELVTPGWTVELVARVLVTLGCDLEDARRASSSGLDRVTGRDAG